MADPIRLIVGLGNPGAEYEHTRHNAGFWLVERFARQEGISLSPDKKFFGLSGKGRIGGQECYLLMPTTFMNRSGQAVAALANFYKIKTYLCGLINVFLMVNIWKCIIFVIQDALSSHDNGQYLYFLNNRVTFVSG